MTTTPLTRHYANLTADERFALLTAAFFRKDEVEQGRLLNAAPRLRLLVPHTFPQALAILNVCDTFARERLELAFFYQRAMRAFDDASFDAPPLSSSACRMRDAGRVYAYLMGIYRDAWRCFGADIGVDLDALDEMKAGAPVIRDAEREAEFDTPSPDEAQKILRRVSGEEGTLRTADMVLAEMHAVYRTIIGYFD